jgi:hypothetical protein
VDGKIFNSRGVLVAIVLGPVIFDLKGKKLYDIRGVKHQEAFGQINRQAVPGRLGAVW